MARHRKDLGARKSVRINLHKPGFLIPAPDAPWIECQVADVSDEGGCLDVGALAVPKIFGLSFTPGGEVLRVCLMVWRRGGLIGPVRQRQGASPRLGASSSRFEACERTGRLSDLSSSLAFPASRTTRL
jgi:hypothetical protein